MPFATEHSARIRNPNLFLRIRQLWSAKGIRALGGPLKSKPNKGAVVQAIRFKASRYTPAQAKAWLKKHDYKWIMFEKATGEKSMEEKALTHNNTVADTEPFWGDVVKTKLPRKAFARMGDPDKVSTWGFPHHWIKGGGSPDDDGRYTAGTMYLHEGGLNAAWAAAQGARGGRKAEAAVINHLQSHRKALGKKNMENLDMSIEAILSDRERQIHKDVRYNRIVEDAKLAGKAKLSDPTKDGGWIEGYMTQWNVVDHQKEIVRQGSTLKSIQERVPAGKVKLMVKHFAHGGDTMECIGTVTEAKEDGYGLWFHAELIAKDALAQAVRNKVVQNHVSTCSIGYSPIQWGFLEIDGKQIVEHKELKVWEVTITVQPANEGAVLIAAKSLIESENLAAFLNEDLSSKTAEEKARLLETAFESREQAEELCKTLLVLHGKLSELLSKGGTPQATDTGADGQTLEPPNTPQGQTGKHVSRCDELERSKLEVMKLRNALHNPTKLET